MRGAQRSTAGILALATSLSLLGDMLLYTVLPSRPAAAGLGMGGLSVILSVHRFIRLLWNSLGGLLYDRFGRRQPFLLGTALAVTSTFGYLLAWGFWPLFAARLVWGAAFALISVGGLSILLDLTGPADRGRALGFFQSLVNVGTLTALLLSGVLADLLGYRQTLALFTTLTALGWLAAFLVLRETKPGQPRLFRRYGPSGNAAARSVARSAGGELLALVATYRRLDRRLLAPAYVSFTSFLAGNGVLMATLGTHVRMQVAAGGSPEVVPLASLTGILLGVRKLGIMLAAPLSGALADRVADRRRVAGAGLLTSLLGFTVLAGGRGLWPVVAGVTLAALGEGILLPALTAWAGDLTPSDHRGVVMGGLATANDLGGALGPLLGHALGAALGFGTAYGLCTVFFVSAGAALLAVGPGPRHLEIIERSTQAEGRGT